MNIKDTISPGADIPTTINVIVEIPKGSQNKYEYDAEHGITKLDRVLFSPLHYPGDYGFVPQTLAKDGDPLDALVMVSFPTYPATLIEARPIGVMEMIDHGEEDDKILCVPTTDIRFENVQDISDVHQPMLDEIAHFFTVYKELEGKSVDVVGWHNAAKAKEIIQETVDRYQNK